MSFTGIGRIGSQHTLTSPQDNAKYLFRSAMWCTHPLLGDEFIGANSFEITKGSKIVTGTSTAFTVLCGNMEITNVPNNKYIAYYNGSSGYGVLEVDYVLDDLTLILKYPAFESGASISKASLIDYWGTPILKEVEVLPNLGGSTATFFTANKYSSNTYTLYDYPWSSQNEGGLEPMLISSTTDAITILKY